MRFEFKLRHLIGVVSGILLLVLDLLVFRGTRWFQPLFGVGLFILISQFWIDVLKENKKQAEIEIKLNRPTPKSG